MGNERAWWRLSVWASLAFAAAVGLLWHHADTRYAHEPGQLVVDADVTSFLARHDELCGAPSGEPPHYIPTGVFIQSLAFESATDVNFSGYVWQIYEDAKDTGLTRGFVLPESVHSPGALLIQEVYRRHYVDDGADGPIGKEVIGWYVEATLRQSFDYADYPLDHKTVWIRMWHADFDRNVVLTPDLGAYDTTAMEAAFGIDQAIVLGGWRIEETFFKYIPSSYDTNFGIRDYIGQHDFPELHFNVVIRRMFLNAFIVNLVPLIVVAALLFAILMSISRHEERIALFGFNFSGVIGGASALFFVVLIAHIQLRQQFETDRIVYLEHFYLLMYVAILLVAINAYLFAVRSPILRRFVQYGDNLLPKLLYWPLLLGTAFAFTFITFGGHDARPQRALEDCGTRAGATTGSVEPGAVVPSG